MLLHQGGVAHAFDPTRCIAPIAWTLMTARERSFVRGSEGELRQLSGRVRSCRSV